MSIIEKLGITPNWQCNGAYLTADGFKVGEYIADVHPFGMPNKALEQFSNVRLIEAAPEMLEALIEITSEQEKYYINMFLGSKTEDLFMEKHGGQVKIIEKATGKSWEEIKALRD